MTEGKPIPESLLPKMRAIEAALNIASEAHSRTLIDLGNQQQNLIDELCEAEGLNRKKVQIAVLTDRGEYTILKEFEGWEQVASALTEDVDKQEHQNVVALCYTFAHLIEAGIEMPDTAREHLLKQAENLDPVVQERLKAYLYG